VQVAAVDGAGNKSEWRSIVVNQPKSTTTTQAAVTTAPTEPTTAPTTAVPTESVTQPTTPPPTTEVPLETTSPSQAAVPVGTNPAEAQQSNPPA